MFIRKPLPKKTSEVLNGTKFWLLEAWAIQDVSKFIIESCLLRLIFKISTGSFSICFSKPSIQIKKFFTLVLKGHIAVANTDITKHDTGKKLDILARKFLKKCNLDYGHGTGHGVGCFLNVHEGPQSISKFNNIKLLEGMVLSNEPGFYKEGKFGIRI